MNDNPKISLIHYWLFSIRGGEQVIGNIGKAISISKIYSLFGWLAIIEKLFGKIPYQFSLLNFFPKVKNYYRSLLPLYPLGMATLKVENCDIVISSESGPAKTARIPKNALHICYCHTPMRYLWSHYEEYLNTLAFLPKVVFRITVPFLRKWDRKSADKVHFFIANSKVVQERIRRFYDRESTIIYPPVRYEMFYVSDKKEDYYFILSALVSYKRIDLAVQAFNLLGYRLKIAGDGPEFIKLKKMANPNIEFLGRVDDKNLPDLYAKAKAFVFPGEEDFGITPLEAQASGTPVIAFRKGGVLETVKDGKTGIFFDNQKVEDLINAVKSFEKEGIAFNPHQIRESVAQFSEERFQREFKNFVYEKWEEFQSQR